MKPLPPISIAPCEEHPDLLNHLPILNRVDPFTTGTKASAHLIIDAGPQAMSKFGIDAGSDRKEPTDQLQSFSEGGSRWIGTEIERTIFFNPPYETQCRIFFFQGEFETGVILIIPELHIIAGMVSLDEVILKNQGLLLCVGDNGVNISHFFQHREGFRLHS